MDIIFIRHGETLGNTQKRYVGSTDECLTENGINDLHKKEIIRIDKLYVSPMKRCIQTAKILYKNMIYEIVENFKECNFGDFEYKNYEELKNNKLYQQWIDSNGEISFPNGESKKDFQKRCIFEFVNIINTAKIKDYKKLAFIVHNGTIMSILDYFSKPHKDYYDWSVKNGCGFFCTIDEKKWFNNEKYIIIYKKY